MLHKLYAALPVALQHACATAQGAKYHHWRYSGVFQDYLATLKRTEYLPARAALSETRPGGIHR